MYVFSMGVAPYYHPATLHGSSAQKENALSSYMSRVSCLDVFHTLAGLVFFYRVSIVLMTLSVRRFSSLSL